MARPPSADSLLRNMKPRPEVKAPIATDIFIPNHSGIASHPEANANFLKIDGSNADQLINIAPYGLTATTISTDELIGTDGASNDTVFYRSGGGVNDGGRLVQSSNGNTWGYSDRGDYLTKMVIQENYLNLSVGSGFGVLNTLTMDGTSSIFSDTLNSVGALSSNTSVSVTNGGFTNTITQPNIFGASTQWDIGAGGGAGAFLQIITGGNVIHQFDNNNIVSGAGIKIAGDLDHNGTKVGFYATAPIVKQTGVAVTAAGIHAALVNLGLIT